jgi:hypothetical protein
MGSQLLPMTRQNIFQLALCDLCNEGESLVLTSSHPGEVSMLCERHRKVSQFAATTSARSKCADITVHVSCGSQTAKLIETFLLNCP